MVDNTCLLVATREWWTATDGQLAPQEIENIEDYIVALYTMVIENLNRSHLNQQDWYRTVSIRSLDIGPRVKELSDQQKDSLLMSRETRSP